MTKQADVINDPKYVPVLDHGFVGLIDHMGSDYAVVQAARTSYGDGTKSVSEDRGLLRYLMRAHHTSPFEMCEVKLHIKLPIFIARQLIRHRTASLNEYSGRYSVMTDEFYMPEPDYIAPQSKDNKQGRSGDLSDEDKTGVRWMIEQANRTSYDIYKALLGDRGENKRDVWCDPYDPADPLLSDDFGGIARELARTILPTGNYTELYWKQDLHNLFHLLRLRMDPHAQREIRDVANAIYDLIQPLFPESVQAFEDYIRQATHNSRMETSLLKALLACPSAPKVWWTDALLEAGSDKAFADKYEMSPRELREFATQWGLPAYGELTKSMAAASKRLEEEILPKAVELLVNTAPQTPPVQIGKTKKKK
jgi:thymidylate synthase (FAD)